MQTDKEKMTIADIRKNPPIRQVVNREAERLHIPQERAASLSRSVSALNRKRHLMGKSTPARLKLRKVLTPQSLPTVRTLRNSKTFRSERYTVIEPLDEGGMGAVYRARDELLHMNVAMKFLPRRLLADKEMAIRFKQEATIVMQLSHEHIVKLHNLQVECGRLFLIMELLDGPTLRELLLRRKQLSVAETVAVCRACARGLEHAHRHGVIHKDIKPENIMFTSDGTLKIVDFGTAIRASDYIPDSQRAYVEGTPCYMSPEQIQGTPLDWRTDMYSLALVLYECLIGWSAFPFDSRIEDMMEFELPSTSMIPDNLAWVLKKALVRDRDLRWNTMDDFLSAFSDTAAEYIE